MDSVLTKALVLCLILTTISACSQIAVKKPVSSVVNPSTKQQSWKTRQQVLTNKKAWNLNSKIALRYRDEHWTFGLNWLQTAAKQYVMQIKNPVTGSIVAKLSKNNRGVSLLADDGKIYRDADEERLLQRQSGVQLPLKGMQYWVRGLTSPDYKLDQVILDAKGRPITIFQSGWKISYARYLNSSIAALPTKVVITRQKDNVYLKMIAKKWY